MNNATAAGAKPKKRRAPPRRVKVRAREQVTPRVIRIVFEGAELENFGPPLPGAHMKLFFPPEGADWPPSDGNPDAPRPPSRTYTPRRYDPDARTLEVEFVLHGDGLAANWVQQASVGDDLTLAGPGGGYAIPEDISAIVIAADDTALPAAGMILEALPKGCDVTLLCEVADAEEERPLSPVVSAEPQWLHYETNRIDQGRLLEKAVRELPETGPDVHFWVACEANAMRRIRDHLLKERGVDPARLHVRGYWRLGETNYPDHDYGKD